MMFNKNMIGRIQKIVNAIENSLTSFWPWLATFSGIIVCRILVENWLENFRSRSGLFLFYEFTHTFLFFLIAYLIFLWILHKFLKTDFKKVSNILLWGYLLIISPPIFDFIISGGKGFWSFYKFDGIAGLFQRFLTFFGDKPEIGITYGVRIEIAAALFFVFIYSIIKLLPHNFQLPIPNFQQKFKFKSNKFRNLKIGNFIGNWELGIRNLKNKLSLKNITKASGITLIAYVVFFILGTFPSWVTIAFKGFSKGFFSVSDIDIVQMFLTPAKIFSREITDIVSSLNVKMSIIYSLLLVLLSVVGCWLLSREKLKAFLANARYPQLIYHGGLLIVGAGLAYIFTGAPIEINFFNVTGLLVLLSAVFFAWLASVVVNDFADKNIDRVTNTERPLVQKNLTEQEYKSLGWILFAASLLFAGIVNFKVALLILAYQLIAWIYSSWPLRLKRFAFISTFLSALASLMILFSGFTLVSPDQNISRLPFPIIALLVIGYTLSLPVKDFKDIEGDKKNGVWTVPVLFGEYWGKIVIGGGLFLSFIASVAIFNEFRLFWWALLCGAMSFWIILSSGENKLIAYKRLPWWILGVVILYGLILVKIIFYYLLLKT